MFGGAGGQHACSIASTLGVKRIIIPRLSSLLSAHGMALADVVREMTEPAAFTLSNKKDEEALSSRTSTLVEKAEADLLSQGFSRDRIASETYLNCRYHGSSTQLMIEKPGDGDYEKKFFDVHKREFGFNLSQRDVLVDDIRVRAVGMSYGPETRSPYADFDLISPKTDCNAGRFQSKQVYFDGPGWMDTAVVPLKELSSGERVHGPAIIFDDTQTILVEPAYLATSLPEHVILDQIDDMTVEHEVNLNDPEHVDPVRLSVYGHRLMGIAEQMGDVWRKISISVNIKERLDYSCAIFAADGGLVANAPHIPCHLGAMSHAVRHQARIHGDTLQEGDVLVSNHPAAGGSHLPDLTVITPAFFEGEIIFWTAARAHHADIGGIRAGSMPPFSKELWEEGAQTKSFKLVKSGKFDEEGMIKILSEEPALHPGCSGTRTLSDNLSDLHAQIAACHRGVGVLTDLVWEQGLDVVQYYMQAIMRTAERAVRDLLRQISKRFGGKPLEAVDWLDDGTAIKLKVTIDETDGSAEFDFTGTSAQV